MAAFIIATVLAPMLATLKELSSSYKTLRKETRDLQATIAPAVKQVKRDLLKTLAEVDQQYKYVRKGVLGALSWLAYRCSTGKC